MAKAAVDGSGSAVQRVVRGVEDLALVESEPGAELPSESELGAGLGVRRLTAREAITALRVRALVDIRPGRGPTVAYPNARPVNDVFTSVIRRDPRLPLDLVEVRRAVEARIAALAAGRARRAELAATRDAIDTIRKVAPRSARARHNAADRSSAMDTDEIHDADMRFHESPAAARGNQLSSVLIEAMGDPSRAGRPLSPRGHRRRGGTADDVIDQHATILDRIGDHDAAGAAAAMSHHLTRTERDPRAAFAAGGEPTYREAP